MATGIFVSGDYAYIANWDSLLVVDVSDPANPNPIGSYSTSKDARDVFVSGDYAYVATGESGLLVVEVMRNRCRQFAGSAVAQSTTVFSGSSSNPLVHATLSSSVFAPSDTNITYYLSADGGLHWEQVTLDSEHYFMYTGYQLKWKAVLTTSHSLKTPTISSLSISYTTGLPAPSLLSPENDSSTSDTTPIFEWESVSGAARYLIQLDTVTTFDSLNLLEATVSSTSYTAVSALTNGTWYWRVAGIDSEENTGRWSSTWSLKIETAEEEDDKIGPFTYEQWAVVGILVGIAGVVLNAVHLYLTKKLTGKT